jgi:hypothetical protein
MLIPSLLASSWSHSTCCGVRLKAFFRILGLLYTLNHLLVVPLVMPWWYVDWLHH